MKRSYVIAPADRLGLNREEAAEYVGVSPSLFDEMVDEGVMPRPKKVHSRLIWSRKRIEKAFDALPEKEPEKDASSLWHPNNLKV